MMRNEGSVAIRKAAMALGVGLLEMALEREGRKGCSPILCTEPVALEPPYRVFNTQHILGQGADRTFASELGHSRLATLCVLAAANDLLSIPWTEEMLRALSQLEGPLSFEVFGNVDRVSVRFAVPMGEVSGFRTGLLGTFPSLVVRRGRRGFPRSGRCQVMEFYPVGPYHRSLTLVGKEGVSVVSLAVQVLRQLEGGAYGLMQVLLCPSSEAHDWHFNIENLLEAEDRAVRLAQLGGLSSRHAYDHLLPPLREPSAREKVRVEVGFYAVVVRCAVWDAPPRQLRAFMQGMRVAMGLVRFGNRAWRSLSHEALVSALGAKAVRRMVTRRLTHRPGLMLTSREVATLVHLPNARALSLFPMIMQRHGLPWQPLADAKSAGAAGFGTNEYAGTTQRVVVPLRVRLRHTYVVGVTGMGKSVLLEGLAVTDARAGLGLCLVDPHGDLCLEVFARLPAERRDDLVYVAFGERGLVPRWNPFQAPVSPAKLADDVTRAILAQTTTRGPRMETNLRMLSYTVSALGGTLDDLAELAGRTERGEHLRERALAEIANPQVQRFLRRDLPSYGPRELDSVTNKLAPFLLDPNLGAMFRQRKNELNPRAWMDQGKIVLINLSAGQIGSDHARFVGSLLVSLLYHTALTRADTPPAQRRPFVLAIDEFQTLQTATLTNLLSEGRKYGIAAILAHQERGQLAKPLAQALGNCATKVIFRPSEDDLAHCQRILGSRVDADTLRALTVGRAMIACNHNVASLTTHPCPHPRVREPRSAIRAYTTAHYLPIAENIVAPPRRSRVYDTFGGEE